MELCLVITSSWKGAIPLQVGRGGGGIEIQFHPYNNKKKVGGGGGQKLEYLNPSSHGGLKNQ